MTPTNKSSRLLPTLFSYRQFLFFGSDAARCRAAVRSALKGDDRVREKETRIKKPLPNRQMPSQIARNGYAGNCYKGYLRVNAGRFIKGSKHTTCGDCEQGGCTLVAFGAGG